MRRKSFGALAGVAGLVLAVTLGIAWQTADMGLRLHPQHRAQPARRPANLLPGRGRLRARQGRQSEITPSMIPSISQYAGQQMLTGQQAEAYADHFIAVHIAELGAGKTYSQLSAEAITQPGQHQTRRHRGHRVQG